MDSGSLPHFDAEQIEKPDEAPEWLAPWWMVPASIVLGILLSIAAFIFFFCSGIGPLTNGC